MQAVKSRHSGIWELWCEEGYERCDVFGMYARDNGSEWDIGLAYLGQDINPSRLASCGSLMTTGAFSEKRYQALPAFPYCKWQRVGQGVGMRLSILILVVPLQNENTYRYGWLLHGAKGYIDRHFRYLCVFTCLAYIFGCIYTINQLRYTCCGQPVIQDPSLRAS